MSRRVTLVDVTARDGLQDEPRFVATADKVAVVEALAAAGIAEIEATSFVHQRWVPQLADAEALVAALPRVTNADGASASVRPSALIMNERGFARAVAAFDAAGFARGAYDLVFVVSASERHNRANNNRTIAETLAYFDTIAERARTERVSLRATIACAFVSPWADETISAHDVARIAERLAAGGCATITLADTIGKAHVDGVGATVAAVADRVRVPLGLHFHDLHGNAAANVAAGLDCGVRRFEGVLGGIGGCPFAPDAPANLDLELLAALVADGGYATGVDLGALSAARAILQTALANAAPLDVPPHPVGI